MNQTQRRFHDAEKYLHEYNIYEIQIKNNISAHEINKGCLIDIIVEYWDNYNYPKALEKAIIDIGEKVEGVISIKKPRVHEFGCNCGCGRNYFPSESRYDRDESHGIFHHYV